MATPQKPRNTQPPPQTPLPPQTPQQPSTPIQPPPTPAPPSQEVEGKEVVKVRADLYLFDERSSTFFLYEAVVRAALHNLEQSKEAITCNSASPSLAPLTASSLIIDQLYVSKGDKVLISQRVSNEMYMHFDSVSETMVTSFFSQFAYHFTTERALYHLDCQAYRQGLDLES